MGFPTFISHFRHTATGAQAKAAAVRHRPAGVVAVHGLDEDAVEAAHHAVLVEVLGSQVVGRGMALAAC